MVTPRLDPKTANEMLLRERTDYGRGSENDPTIRNRCNLALQAFEPKPRAKRTPKVVPQNADLSKARQETFDDYGWTLPKKLIKPAKTKKMSLKKALPTPPKRTPLQLLMATTSLVPSAFTTNLVYVPQDAKVKHKQNKNGPNWPLFENVLKLYAFIKLYHSDLTPQQRVDREALIERVQQLGNARPDGTQKKRNRLHALQIIANAMTQGRKPSDGEESRKPKHPYLKQGLQIIQARTEARDIAKRKWAAEHLDQKMSFDEYLDLERRTDKVNHTFSIIDAITSSARNDDDYRQRVNMNKMAHKVFETVRDAYKTK